MGPTQQTQHLFLLKFISGDFDYSPSLGESHTNMASSTSPHFQGYFGTPRDDVRDVPHAVSQDLGYMVNKMYKYLGGTVRGTLDFEDETFRIGHG